MAVTLTIRDASRATGLSVKALQRRIERGTLSATLVDGVRRIPMSDLLAAGLLRTDASAGPARPAGDAALAQRVAELERRLAEVEAQLARLAPPTP